MLGPWVVPAIEAAGSIIGNMFSSSGQSSANATNLQIARENNQFNSAQAQLNRDWQEKMSNTAMQRRMEDNKRAGVNPLLAVSAGGASSPTGGSASSSGNPVMQNTRGSFGNLGSQLGSALQAGALQAQIRDTNASAALKEAQTPDNGILPLTPDGHVDIDQLFNSTHALGNLNAVGLAQMLDVNKANIAKTEAATREINQAIESSKADVQLTKIQTAIAGLSRQQLESINQWLLKSAIAEAKLDMAKVPGAEAEAKIFSGPKGVAIKAVQLALGSAGDVMGLAHGGVGIAGKIKDMGGSVTHENVRTTTGKGYSDTERVIRRK